MCVGRHKRIALNSRTHFTCKYTTLTHTLVRSERIANGQSGSGDGGNSNNIIISTFDHTRREYTVYTACEYIAMVELDTETP